MSRVAHDPSMTAPPPQPPGRPAPSARHGSGTSAATGPATPLADRPPRFKDRVTLAGLKLLSALPYLWRVRLAGWVGRWVLAHTSSIRPRIRAAVRHLFPDLPEAEIARISAKVPENMARTAVEIISGADFYAHAAPSPITGPGWEALQDAQRTGRPAILLTAHFGNAAAVGAALKGRGFSVATYFKPMPDPALNRFYTAAVEAVTSPLFPTGREGVAGMIRHLRGGGMLSISFDLDRPHGVMLDFLGKPTRTVLSMAEMALKYDALLVPVYGIRRADGLNFDVFIDTPIPPGKPEEMTQAINDSLGRMVTRHKDQWLWWHHRWKEGRPSDPSDQRGA